MDAVAGDAAVAAVAQVDALAVGIRAVVADLQVLDTHVVQAGEVEALVEPRDVDLPLRRARAVGELQPQRGAVEEETAGCAGRQRAQFGQARVAEQAPLVADHVRGGEAGRARPDAAAGVVPGGAGGDRRVGAVEHCACGAAEHDRLRRRAGNRHAHAFAVDAGRDRDEVACAREIGGALDRLHRPRRSGAVVRVGAVRRHVQRAQRREGAGFRARGEGARARRRRAGAVGIGEGDAHLVGASRRQLEQAADEVRRVDARQRMAGAERGFALHPPFQARAGVAVRIAADAGDHAAGLQRAVGVERAEADRVLGEERRAGHAEERGEETSEHAAAQQRKARRWCHGAAPAV